MERAIVELGITPGEIVAMTRQAHRAAFLHHDEALRARLQERFESWVAQNPPPS
jgi:hypothetical protein